MSQKYVWIKQNYIMVCIYNRFFENFLGWKFVCVCVCVCVCEGRGVPSSEIRSLALSDVLNLSLK